MAVLASMAWLAQAGLLGLALGCALSAVLAVPASDWQPALLMMAAGILMGLLTLP